MKNPVLIAGVAAIVALVAAGIVFAGTGDDDAPTIRNPALPTVGAGDQRPPVGPGTPIPSEPQVPVTPTNPGANPQLPPGRAPEAAPIDGLDINVAESFPPQYFLQVSAGLPSGCAQQYRHDVERHGDEIKVSVLNSFPTARDIVCTAIYGIYELNIALGSDFEPGETYTVKVNDQEITFTAQ